MKEDELLMCLIAFVLGYLVQRMMRGNGLSVGGDANNSDDGTDKCECISPWTHAGLHMVVMVAVIVMVVVVGNRTHTLCANKHN